MEIPSIGEKFPKMKVLTTHGELELPDYFEGKWFVLFSHPADFTPVCTCLLYTSPSPRDGLLSRMPSSA